MQVQNKNINKEIFISPPFFKRMKSLLKLDFYRLFHTPYFYIMIAVAAIIPAMILTMAMDETVTVDFSNAWNLIAPNSPAYAISDMGEYANINMIYIFGGILLAIFIGRDYQSGFIKNIFVVHSKKTDYAISKTIVGAFSMICMILAYILGTVISGLLTAKSFDVNVGNLINCLIAKMFLTIGFSALFTMISVFFRKQMWISIIGTFFFGTGLLVMGMGMMGLGSLMNVFLYGSAVGASLSTGIITVITALVCALIWGVIYTILSKYILQKRDLA